MSSKKTAALSASLLVRKGNAAPTGYGAGRQPSGFAPVLITGSNSGKSDGAKAARRRHRNADNDAGQLRVSVRMGIAEHLRLKLAAAHVQCSMSDIVTSALESYIDRLAPNVKDGHCECITMSAPDGGDKQAASQAPTLDRPPRKPKNS